jgi:hypothetical protein
MPCRTSRICWPVSAGAVCKSISVISWLNSARDSTSHICSSSGGESACADGNGCLAAIARHYLKFDFHPRDKPARIPIEYRGVQENIFATIIGSDESVTATLIELQYPARSQLGYLLPLDRSPPM